VTLHQARVAAQKVFAAKLEGRDPAAEKREAKRRVVADRVEDLLETFIAQRLSQNRSGGEIARLLRREMGKTWVGRSIHEISKRDIVELVSAIEQRGAPVAANKALKSIKTFLRWCVGRAILDQSPAEGVPLPSKEVARDRVLDDDELAQVILAARKIGGRMAVSSSCWLSRDSGGKRSPVYSGKSWISHHEFGRSRNRGTKNAKAHVVTPVRAIDSRADTGRPARAICLLSARNQALPGIQSSKAPAGPAALGCDWVAPSRLAPDLRLRDGSAGRCAAYCRQDS